VRCRVLAKCEPYQRGAVRRNAARHRAIDELKLLLVEFQSHDGFIWHGRIPAGGCAPKSAGKRGEFCGGYSVRFAAQNATQRLHRMAEF